MSPDEFANSMRSKGFVLGEDGEWRKPGNAGVRDRDTGSPAELERHPRDGAVGEVQIQEGVGRKVLVRVTSFRRRLLDEDNLCEKYHVDLLRYSGALVSDAAGKAKITVGQQKVGSKEQEFVRLEIFCPVLT